jgi:succinate dehydrogenase/fumarate reductase flavoprotein subunit
MTSARESAIGDPQAGIPTFTADLLVIGGGIAGMSAAAMAAARGKRVILVEKAEQIGGSAALSGGLLWTLESYEALREEVPLGDPDLGRVLIDRYPDAVEWVRSLGVDVADKTYPRYVPRGCGHRFDILGYFDQCRRLIIQSDGMVIKSTDVEELIVEQGRVVGARMRDRDGEAIVRTPWTALATGGFQCDRDLVRKYIGEQAANLLIRSNPNSTGDGLRLGLSVGAATTRDMNGFYGHLMCYPITKEFAPSDFLRLAQSGYSLEGVLLDKAGQRFVDESIGYFNNAQVLTQLPGARALLVGDEIIRLASTTNALEVIDFPLEAEREGAHVARAVDLEGLSALVGAWGYDSDSVLATLTEFNALVENYPDKLSPGRKRNRRALDQPDYFAVEVQPAITFSHGGLRIDTDAQVLQENGEPVRGLLAVGADGAGVHNVGYAGGLATGVVFAMQAVDMICRTAR